MAETTAFTFYQGVANLRELYKWMDEHGGDLPDCEMFAELSEGDFELVEGKATLLKSLLTRT